MADNRLYIVDKESRKYLCIANEIFNVWKIGNIDLMKDFLSKKNVNQRQNNFIIGHEMDRIFYTRYILTGTSFNVSNKWVESDSQTLKELITTLAIAYGLNLKYINSVIE